MLAGLKPGNIVLVSNRGTVLGKALVLEPDLTTNPSVYDSNVRLEILEDLSFDGWYSPGARGNWFCDLTYEVLP